MFREFGDKCRELNKWREHSRSDKVKKYLNQPEAIYFIFALGIYYRYVIAPFARGKRDEESGTDLFSAN